MIVSTVIPVFATAGSKMTPQSLTRGSTFYVGGSGPGNYTKIQDAIDNTSDGDTVFVFPGSYTERIKINTSITLQGSDVLTTLIDGQRRNNDVVTCAGTDILITGFTIWNASANFSCVIINHTSHCTIDGNVIHTGRYGITLRNAQNISIINNSFSKILDTKAGFIGVHIDTCRYCTISKNKISSWDAGIFLHGTHLLITQNTITDTSRGITDAMNALHPWTNAYLTITNNLLTRNKEGIHLTGSKEYLIQHNEITNSTATGIFMAEDAYAGVPPENISIKENTIATSQCGIALENALQASIEGNYIHQNTFGLILLYDSYTLVQKNTFQHNNQTILYRWAFFSYPFILNKVPGFDSNFWDSSRTIPQPVFGRCGLFKPSMFFEPVHIFPWVTFDWHPAQEPFERS